LERALAVALVIISMVAIATPSTAGDVEIRAGIVFNLGEVDIRWNCDELVDHFSISDDRVTFVVDGDQYYIEANADSQVDITWDSWDPDTIIGVVADGTISASSTPIELEIGGVVDGKNYELTSGGTSVVSEAVEGVISFAWILGSYQEFSLSVVDVISYMPRAHVTVLWDDLGLQRVLFGYELEENVTVTEVQWNFGDGNGSTVDSPVHTYAKGGYYQISVAVWTENGAFDYETDYIVVDDISVVAAADGGVLEWIEANLLLFLIIVGVAAVAVSGIMTRRSRRWNSR